MLVHLKNNLFIKLLIGLFILITSASILINKTYAQSTINETWTTPINLSNSGSTTDPQLVVDSEGVFHGIWIDEFDGYVYTQSSDGEQWNPPTPLSLPFQTEDSQPLLLADTIGNIHAFWMDEEDVMYYSHVPGADFGNTSSWKEVIGLAESALDLDAVVDSEGNLHLTYVRALDTEQFPAGIYYRRSLDGGQSWSDGISLYQSKYFRSLDRDNAHVQISSTSVNGDEDIYAAWDDRPIHRVYMTKSIDAGSTWQDPVEITGPGSEPGLTPFDILLSPQDTNLLGLIHTGKAGAYCTQDVFTSIDEGDTWSGLYSAFIDIVGCPQDNRFFKLENGLTILYSIIQDQVYLAGWDGRAWSNPKKQTELFNFIDPIDNDIIEFGCRSMILVEDRFFVIGCEANGSGDIWITSRTVGTITEWYPSPTNWSQIDQITDSENPISNPILLADGDDRFHAIWLQASEDNPEIQLYYSRLVADNWSNPVSILTTIEDSVSSLSAAVDSRGRIIIALSGQLTGNIYFSWANAGEAENPSEWAQPQNISKSSLFNVSPVITVDNSGKFFVAYAVPINEGRGIYLTKSFDEGSTWSQPSLIVDAAYQGFDIVNSPKLIATDDSLNLLWTRHTLSNDGRATELYYALSDSEGTTWSDPELVSESTPVWMDVIEVGDATIHRSWLDILDGLPLFSDQISNDLGKTWELPVNISNFSTIDGTVSLAQAPDNKLHLIHIGEDFENQQRLIHWSWDDQGWSFEEEIVLANPAGNMAKSISVAINKSGMLGILFSNSDIDKLETDPPESLNFIQKQLLLPLQIAAPTPAADEEATPTILPEERLETREPVTATATLTVTDSAINASSINPQPPSTRTNGYRGLIIGGIISVIIVTIPLGLYARRLLTRENR